MKKIISKIVFLSIFLSGIPLVTSPAPAEVEQNGLPQATPEFPAETAEVEIQHLLNYMEASPCRFFRNGKVHTGKKASRHSKRKYKHFKDEGETAADFIRYAGTKSELSGKIYTLQCDDAEPMPLSDWLLLELERFRKEKEEKREK